MARQKKYNEEEVIEKAMHLFWKNGYEATSVRMLEKAMGINQFSMYSSFGSKHGVLLESMKCYESKLDAVVDQLKSSKKGIDGIKEFFYNTMDFAQGWENEKGCFYTNTSNEFAEREDEMIKGEIYRFSMKLRAVFVDKLRVGSNKSEETIQKKATYLLISKQGLSVAAKVYDRQQLNDYVEMVFHKL